MSELCPHTDGEPDEHNQAEDFIKVRGICRCDCFCEQSVS